jgi:hypothetical protein
VDPFVELSLFDPVRRETEKQETSHLINEPNPKWAEKFDFVMVSAPSVLTVNVFDTLGWMEGRLSVKGLTGAPGGIIIIIILIVTFRVLGYAAIIIVHTSQSPSPPGHASVESTVKSVSSMLSTASLDARFPVRGVGGLQLLCGQPFNLLYPVIHSCDQV